MGIGIGISTLLILLCCLEIANIIKLLDACMYWNYIYILCWKFYFNCWRDKLEFRWDLERISLQKHWCHGKIAIQNLLFTLLGNICNYDGIVANIYVCYWFYSTDWRVYRAGYSTIGMEILFTTNCFGW
jgi:hypothetical protein